MSDFTIIRTDPKGRWGQTSHCLDTQNNPVDQSQVKSSWKPNRFLTQSDKDELYQRAQGAQKLVKKYKNAVASAHSFFRGMAATTKEIKKDCERDSTGTTEGGERYVLESQCILFKMGEQINEGRGMLLLDDASETRKVAFKELDFLMVNSPDPDIAQDMCDQKKEAITETRKLYNEIGTFNRYIGEIRAKAFKDYDSKLGNIQDALQGIMSIIQTLFALIEVIIELLKKFAAFMKDLGITALASVGGFLAKHPSLILLLGGAIALGALAFILRPYITIISAIFRK